jgi:hypothetical protein
LNVDEYYEDESLEGGNQFEEELINHPISNQEPLELPAKVTEVDRLIDQS